MTQTFQGFSQGAVDFLWGIRLNNERSWFLAHKEEYLTLVDAPLRLLGAEVARQMTETFPKLGLELKVSRIYRDARRLHGRGPYKEHLWFSLRRPSESEGAAPGFYFELAPEQYSYGMGCYDPTPLTMAKLRARVDRDPRPLARLVRAVEKRGEFHLYGELYKRPKGDPGPLLYPWYNSRNVGVSCERNCEGPLFTQELADQLLDGFRSLEPLYRWLRDLAADPVPEGY